MKKTIRIIALLLVAVTVCLALASCAKTLSGTYSTGANLGSLVGGSVAFKFRGSKVTVSVTTLLAGSSTTKDFEGKYEITTDDNGAEKITFTFEDSGANEYNGSFSFKEGKDADGNKTVTFGGATYTKQ